jgi:pimeloyl-ACP methyl ester carboxylesterase
MRLVALCASLLLTVPTLAQEHVTISTDDGAQIAADLYGKSTRGVVLAHGGRFTKESWEPQAEALVRSGFRVLAFDFRGFGQSHGPGDKDMYTAPMELDVLAAVRYLHAQGAKTVSVVGGSFGGDAAAKACVEAKPGEISRLVMLASESNASADKIHVPLLEIVGRDDKSSDGPRLPHIQAWFAKAHQPKKIVILDTAEHAQFLFQTEHAETVMREIIRFLGGAPAGRKRTK